MAEEIKLQPAQMCRLFDNVGPQNAKLSWLIDVCTLGGRCRPQLLMNNYQLSTETATALLVIDRQRKRWNVKCCDFLTTRVKTEYFWQQYHQMMII